MPQLPQIPRDLLSQIFKNPAARRAYEELQQALVDAPDDIVVLSEKVAAARFQAQAALQGNAQALQLASRQTRAGFGLRSTPDAGGQTLDVVPEQLVLSILPYLPRVTPPPEPEPPMAANDAQNILANRIFGGH